ncbi:MAG: TIGR01777 family protein [Planctomycetes bacterium]|mgnify:FL=1|nr:TIGR01777 family protein [Planctomycetota bacterium]
MSQTQPHESDLTTLPQSGEAILLTGSSGVVGSSLAPLLQAQGYRVLRAVRRAPQSPDEVRWQPLVPAGEIPEEELRAFENLHAVIHLAGENIAGGRWNAARKKRIRESRETATANLSDLLLKLESPPKHFISASAIGGYDQKLPHPQTEETPFIGGFLGEVCSGWENASQPLEEAGIRRALLRIGLVLTPRGGVLQKLLPIFKAFLGGPISSGRQWMSWIDLDDLLQIILRALRDDQLSGPINCTAPGAVRNEDFTTILASKLGRPVAPRVPALALNTLYGEMGQALVVDGARVVPQKLEACGYRFRHPDLPSCLRNQLT